MKVVKLLCLGVAVGGMLATGTIARADFVTYVTTGTFTGGDLSGTSTYSDAANGINITFASALNNSVNVPPTSQVSFGQFDTTATTAANLTGVNATFTLDIFQTGPTAGTTSFVGSLQGTLAVDNSQAFVQFNGPLSSNIDAVIYSIVSADNNTPGRVNIAPSTTNAGLTTIVGSVGTVVPEPSSVVLAALLAPALLALAARGRKSAA